MAQLAPVPGPDPFESQPAVQVEGLRIRYRTTEERRVTLKRTLRHLRKRKRSWFNVEALRDVSFEISKGSVYGIIGNNGAGKSTLCRVLCGILPPTEGRVTLHGHVTPLISLGNGMNRELTGRENIKVGGLANGLDPAEVKDCTEAIIEFADIGDFIDRPMRSYSSGMGGRVAFAIAAHLDPEILVIDEALAAGDAAFKGKCFAKIMELCQRDSTVIIVSHGMSVIKLIAERCLWLDQGEARLEGPADEVVDAYLDAQGLDPVEVNLGDPDNAKMVAALEDF